MKSTGKRILFLFILLTLFIIQAGAITFKVASPAPKGSDWDKALTKLAQEWKKATNGKVRIKIYSGGVIGDEDDMIRKMELNQIQGAILSGIGLNKIVSDLMLLSMPLFIRNHNELDYLLGEMGPDLEKLLYNNDFTLLGWQFIGWVHFYGKKPILSPDDLREQKLAVTQGDTLLQKIWQSMGFQIVPSAFDEIMFGLQTGRIDSFYAPPIMAASYQWFGVAKNMSEMPLSPLLAAFIFSNKAWERVPEEYRKDLKRITREIMEPVVEQSNRMANEAMEVMLENGLIVNSVSTMHLNEWTDIFLASHDELVGPEKAISFELYKKASDILAKYRADNE